MRINLRLFTTLCRYLPPGSEGRACVVELPEGARVMDLVKRLGIPEELPHIVMVNHRKALFKSELAEGDTVSLFPALGGG